MTILSVTEGEDKPLKYPDMFAAAKLMILNKIDLLPHLQALTWPAAKTTPAASTPASPSWSCPPAPAKAWGPGSTGC